MVLHAKQVRAIELLYEGMQKQDIATEIGISVQTLGKWRKNKEFADSLKKLSKDHLYRFVPDLVNNMLDLALNKKVSPQTRLFATQDLLNRIGIGVDYEEPEEVETVNIAEVLTGIANESRSE